MKDFKIKTRYVKLSYEVRVFIKCMEAASDRPHLQKILMCPLIKSVTRAFTLKHLVEFLKHSAEFLRTREKITVRSWVWKTRKHIYAITSPMLSQLRQSINLGMNLYLQVITQGITLKPIFPWLETCDNICRCVYC